MPIDYDTLMNWPLPEITRSYRWKNSALYALGLGLGSDPTDADDLRFVYEKDMLALPTMAAVLGHPGFWISDPRTGINYGKVVHGEQALEIHEPLPAKGTFVARNRVDEIIDKGEGRGMIMRVRRELLFEDTGKLQSTQLLSMFCRGDGGFGGPPARPAETITIPERAPDVSVSRATLPQAALIYRLSGDYNPLHADPEFARRAGFARPILHGMATFGIAGHALLSACAGGRVEDFRSIACRFTAPVLPGETLRTEIWDEGGRKLFRCISVESGKVVLDRGAAQVG